MENNQNQDGLHYDLDIVMSVYGVKLGTTSTVTADKGSAGGPLAVA